MARPKITPEMYEDRLEYKAKQQTFTKWLTSTAIKLRFNFYSYTTTISRDKNGVPQPVPVALLVILTRRITASNKLRYIPDHILPDLERIILLRDIETQFYEAGTDENDLMQQDINEGHRYIVNKLEEMEALLAAKVDQLSTTNQMQSDHATSPDSNKLNTQLESLSLQQPDIENTTQESQEPSLSEVGANTIEQGSDDQRFAEISLEDDVDEIGLHFFLHDLQSWEASVMLEWIASKVGSQSLAGAALVTNLAIDVVRRLEQDLCWAREEDHEGFLKNGFRMLKTTKFVENLPRTASGLILDPIYRMQENVYQVIVENPTAQGDTNEQTDDCLQPSYHDCSIEEQAKIERASFREFYKIHEDVICGVDSGKDADLIRLLRWLHGRGPPESAEDVPLCLAFAARLSVLIGDLLVGHEQVVQASLIKDVVSTTRKIKGFMNLINDQRGAHFSIGSFDMQQAKKTLKKIDHALTATSEQFARQGVMQFRLAGPIKALTFLCEEFAVNTVLMDVLLRTETFVSIATILDLSDTSDPPTISWADHDLTMDSLGHEIIYNGSSPSKVSDKKDLFDIMLPRQGYERGPDMAARLPGARVVKRDASNRDAFSKYTLKLPIDLKAYTVLSLHYREHIANPNFLLDTSVEYIRLYVRGDLLPKSIDKDTVILDIEVSKRSNAKDQVVKEVLHVKNYRALSQLDETKPRMSQWDFACILREKIKKEIDFIQFDPLKVLQTSVRVSRGLASHRLQGKWQRFEQSDLQAQESTDTAQWQSRMYCLELSYLLAHSAKQHTMQATFNAVGHKENTLEVFKKALDDHSDRGCMAIEMRRPEGQSLHTLEPTILTLLRSIHEHYGIPADIFGTDSAREVEWLHDAVALSDMLKDKFTPPKDDAPKHKTKSKTKPRTKKQKKSKKKR